MAIIPLRSPRYESLETPATAVSVKLELTVGGTLRYTIIKDCVATESAVFEIAELCRDYLTPIMASTYPTTQNQTAISRAITFYDTANATGSIVQYDGHDTDTVTHTGVDGYGLFIDGANPTITDDTWLITPEYLAAGNNYQVFIPDGIGGTIQTISSGSITNQSFSTVSTGVTVHSVLMTINRINCTKYGIGQKITFINKFGALQDLWFFLKEVNTLKTKSKNFQRNLMSFKDPDNSAYDIKDHAVNVFNKQGKQTIKLSSGYYPEWTTAWFEELLLSEQVWLTRTDYNNPSADEIIPVNVKTSTMIHKTSLNDNLIDYTIQFEESFDYINNVR